MEHFELIHREGRLFAVATIAGVLYKKDITEYAEGDTGFDDWLDHRLGLSHYKKK
jgi:hypothetical protein